MVMIKGEEMDGHDGEDHGETEYDLEVTFKGLRQAVPGLASQGAMHVLRCSPLVSSHSLFPCLVSYMVCSGCFTI
jgi:hypothetical protein